MSKQDQHYEIVHIVCWKCGAYMIMHHILNHSGFVIIMYDCECGNIYNHFINKLGYKDDK